MARSMFPDPKPPFYRDTRTIAVLVQLVFLVGVLLAGWFLYNNMTTRLAAANTTTGGALSWNFLSQTAGFGISEGPAFQPEESYGRAYWVGVVNTLRVGLTGVLLATVVGLLAGVARVSNNWLIRQLAGVYVDLFRSTPLLVQLLFWYVGVIAALPNIQDAAELGNLGYLTNRGMYLSWPQLTETGLNWNGWLLGGGVVAVGVAWLQRRRLHRSGRLGSGLLAGVVAGGIVAAAGYAVVAANATLPATTSYELRRGDRGTLFEDRNGNGTLEPAIDRTLAYVPITLYGAQDEVVAHGSTEQDGTFRFTDLPAEAVRLTWSTPPPLVLSEPQRQGFNFRGGVSLTPEFAALLLALFVYTGAFIAEIVRAGISAVGKGQWEASRALGLSTGATLQRIVLPQALRVIIPPLTSQYLNLVKNSSLAIAVGYPDLFNVSRTIVNQTGAEVQGIVLVMATYLTFSLVTSLFMNWYNRRVALVER